MAKISFYDMATILVEHNKLAPNIADEFVRTIFDIIQEQLTIDQQVKIKGLGTFKIVSVDARESINVNTGERIVINEHQKISFVPDAAMKELINKPFSQFETVILNDGINFDDTAAETESPTTPETPTQQPETAQQPETTQQPETPTITLQLITPTETPSTTETPSPLPEAAAEEEKEEEVALSQVSDTADAENNDNEEEKNDNENEDTEEHESNTKSIILHVICTIVIAALAAWGGYWYGINHAGSNINTQAVQPSTATTRPQVKKVVKVKRQTAQPVKKDTAATATVTRKDTIKQQQTTTPQKEKEETKEADYSQYAKMDARVRTGAYTIIGEDFTVTVKKGETTARLAKRTLGEGMECYIEVFNGISAGDALKEGQKIKIPKLKLKKK